MLDLFRNNEPGCTQRQKIGSVGDRRETGEWLLIQERWRKARNSVEAES